MTALGSSMQTALAIRTLAEEEVSSAGLEEERHHRIVPLLRCHPQAAMIILGFSLHEHGVECAAIRKGVLLKVRADGVDELDVAEAGGEEEERLAPLRQSPHACATIQQLLCDVL